MMLPACCSFPALSHISSAICHVILSPPVDITLLARLCAVPAAGSLQQCASIGSTFTAYTFPSSFILLFPSPSFAPRPSTSSDDASPFLHVTRRTPALFHCSPGAQAQPVACVVKQRARVCRARTPPPWRDACEPAYQTPILNVPLYDIIPMSPQRCSRITMPSAC